MTIYRLIRVILKQLKTKKFGVGISQDNKIKFEKEVIKLLKKFNLYNAKLSALQRVEIIADIDELPTIKLKYIIVDRPKSKEE